MQLGRVEVARGEVGAAIAAEVSRRQRPGLLDPVVAVLVRHRGVEVADPGAHLDESPREPRGGEVPVAVFLDMSERDAVVEWTGLPAGLDPVALPPEAAELQLGDDLARRLSAAGDDVEGSPEGVPAEQHRGASDHLDPGHVLQRDQIEVDLLHGGLVEANAVEEHADALGQAGDRGGGEAAQDEIRLEGIALLALEGDARLALEHLRQPGGVTGLHLRPPEGVHRARDPVARETPGQRRRRGDQHRRQCHRVLGPREAGPHRDHQQREECDIGPSGGRAIEGRGAGARGGSHRGGAAIP